MMSFPVCLLSRLILYENKCVRVHCDADFGPTFLGYLQANSIGNMSIVVLAFEVKFNM